MNAPENEEQNHIMTATPTQEERQVAMFTHPPALAGFVIPFGNIIGPLMLCAYYGPILPPIPV